MQQPVYWLKEWLQQCSVALQRREAHGLDLNRNTAQRGPHKATPTKCENYKQDETSGETEVSSLRLLPGRLETHGGT
jgi:hypothetical protein